MRTMRTWGVLGLTATTGILLLSAVAWACIAGPGLNLSSSQAAPGSPLALSGFSFDETLPVDIRLNDLDGAVLGTFTVDEDQAFAGDITIPADAAPGNAILIATQSAADGSLAQSPTRAVVDIVGAGGAPTLGAPTGAPDLERPVGLAENDESVGIVSLVLVGVGVAAVALFLAGMAALAMGRRSTAPEAARVKE